MAKNIIEADLFCMNCGEDTKHDIEYRQGQIYKITCEKCGANVQLNQEFVNQHFKEEFVKRVMSKPVRMTREMERDLSSFLKYLPARVITKPYRVYKEYTDSKTKE